MVARALVVGVPATTVPVLADIPLAGATRDAERIGELLGRRGFDEVDVHPDGTSKEEFKDLACALSAATGADDLGLIYVSGHGYSSPSSDPDDEGFDECLVFTDEVLPDNWFGTVFWPGVKKGSTWITCADTCFSATAMEAALYLHIVDSMAKPPRTIDREGLTRLSLAAAGQRELAQQVSDRERLLAGWYTSQVLSLIEESPALTYGELWTRMDVRWQQQSQTLYSLGRPWMALTPDAGDLIGAPAFASLGFSLTA